jgi:protein-tyrosine phosphatase
MQYASEEGTATYSEPTEIIPNHLWQGAWPADLGVVVEQLRLDLVVNLEFTQHDPLSQGNFSFETIWFPMHDSDTLPELPELHGICRCVTERIRRGERVLVHCAAGLNRSGLVTALVVRDYYGIEGSAAVDIVRSKRPWALSNITFAEYVASLNEADYGGFHNMKIATKGEIDHDPENQR